MNGFVDFMFAELWRYTVLTFRIFWWIFTFIIGFVSGFLNARQNIDSDKHDEFDKRK
jgi:hypothetical protein